MVGQGIWQPNEEGLREIYAEYLEQQISTTSDKPRNFGNKFDITANSPISTITSNLACSVRKNEELQNEVCQVLLGYKQILKDGAWEQCPSAMEPQVKEKLSKYGV